MMTFVHSWAQISWIPHWYECTILIMTLSTLYQPAQLVKKESTALKTNLQHKCSSEMWFDTLSVLLKYRVYTYLSSHCTSRHLPRLNMSPFTILIQAMKADEYNADRCTDWYSKNKDQDNNKRWKKVKVRRRLHFISVVEIKTLPRKKKWREWCRGIQRRMSHFRVCGVSHSFLNTRQGNRPHTCTVQRLKLYSRAQPRSAKTLKTQPIWCKTLTGCAFHLRC